MSCQGSFEGRVYGEKVTDEGSLWSDTERVSVTLTRPPVTRTPGRSGRTDLTWTDYEPTGLTPTRVSWSRV